MEQRLGPQNQMWERQEVFWPCWHLWHPLLLDLGAPMSAAVCRNPPCRTSLLSPLSPGRVSLWWLWPRSRRISKTQHCLINPNHCLQPRHTRLPVAQRKQFFFFFPALQTFTMQRRRSSLGVKMSLWSACLMAVMVDAVHSTSSIQQGSTVSNSTDSRVTFLWRALKN